MDANFFSDISCFALQVYSAHPQPLPTSLPRLGRILDLFGFGEENNCTTALAHLVGLFLPSFWNTPLLMSLPTKVLRCTHPRGSFLPLLYKVWTMKCLGVFSGWNMLPTSPPRKKTIKKGSLPPHNKSSTSKHARFFPQRLVAEGFEGLSTPFKKDLKQRDGNLSTRFLVWTPRGGMIKLGPITLQWRTSDD